MYLGFELVEARPIRELNMRNLFIAEKPSVAQALAEHLGVTQRTQGYYLCGNDVVTNCVGHLFEMAMPEDYDKRFATWNFEDLPIAPTHWPWLPKKQHIARIRQIGELLRHAECVIHVGDPDNEGQLLVDNVILENRYRGPVMRLWAQACDPVTLSKALANLTPNDRFRGMRDSALARGRGDWRIGFNGTRAFTALSRALGRGAVVHVGRVSTPTLALVAERDKQFANFKPIPYFVIAIDVAHPVSGTVRLKWQPRDDQAGLDEKGRLTSSLVADELLSRLRGRVASVSAFETDTKLEGPPRAFSLATIGLAASRKFGMTAADTLKICQSLYETHKLTTYPRTDCDYLPEAQHASAPEVLAALRSNLPDIERFIDEADPTIKSKTWDDTKVTAHYGIIPTAMRADLRALSPAELAVYQLVVQAYIAQFYPPHKFDVITMRASAADEAFAAKGKHVLEAGWRQLYGAGEGEEDPDLPTFTVGEQLEIQDAHRLEKRTTHPERFTEGTLPVAMENIYRYMEDDADRASLKDGDGIGTPATRGPIIEELKRRGYLVNSGKFLVSTPAAQAMLELLPPVVKSASLTAAFSRVLRGIEQGVNTIEDFQRTTDNVVDELMAFARAAMPEVARHVCPACDGGQLQRHARRDGRGHFWGCNRYKLGCSYSANDVDGAPAAPAAEQASDAEPAISCPTCGRGLQRKQRRTDGHYFWGCAGYRDGCRFTAEDRDGAPAFESARA